MGKKSYIITEVDIYTMKGIRLLDGFSEKTRGIPVLDDGELDANEGIFEEDTTSTKGLWDE